MLSLASRTGSVSTRQGSWLVPSAGSEDGGADGDRMGAGVSALPGKKRQVN